MALKEKTQIFAVKKESEYMGKAPEVNIPKLMDWVETLTGKVSLQHSTDYPDEFH